MDQTTLDIYVKEKEAEAAAAAEQYIALSALSEETKQEIEGLKLEKARLEKQIIDSTNLIKEKNDERQQSLNERAEAISVLEDSVETKRLDLIRQTHEFEKLQEDLMFRVEHVSIIEKDNALRKAELDARETEIAKREAAIKEDEAALNEKRADLNSLSSKVNEALISANRINMEAEKTAKENEEISRRLEEEADDLQRRGVAAEETIRRLKAWEADLDKKDAEIKSRMAVADARDKEHKGRLEIIELENKKIQLAWLQVNKRIQERQLDIDIKELQK